MKAIFANLVLASRSTLPGLSPDTPHIPRSHTSQSMYKSPRSAIAMYTRALRAEMKPAFQRRRRFSPYCRHQQHRDVFRTCCPQPELLREVPRDQDQRAFGTSAPVPSEECNYKHKTSVSTRLARLCRRTCELDRY
jgi:hypothetical protein